MALQRSGEFGLGVGRQLPQLSMPKMVTIEFREWLLQTHSQGVNHV
jgi:hypothetical protein